MLYPYLPVVGLLGSILALIPLPRQIEAKNIAIISISFYLCGSSFIYGINPIIWDGNVVNSAPVWCDIANKFRECAVVGLPAATFCIGKHLELISSRRPIPPDANRLLRRGIFDSVMCFALPCLWLFVFYAFQNSRFLIIEDFGCYSDFFLSNIAVAIIFSLPVLLSVGSLVYGSISLYHLINNLRTNSKLLTPQIKPRDAGLPSTQYYRLMAASIILSTWSMIWLMLSIKYITDLGSSPLPSWKEIHAHESRVISLPRVFLTPKISLRFRLLWWGMPGSAYIFFLWFFTSQEVLSVYQKLWTWFRTTVLRWPIPEESFMEPSKSSDRVLPVYIKTTVVTQSESSVESLKFSTKSPGQ